MLYGVRLRAEGEEEDDWENPHVEQRHLVFSDMDLDLGPVAVTRVCTTDRSVCIYI